MINVSVPYTPWPAPPTELMRAMWGDRFFYILYFQQPEAPERELEADISTTMRTMLWAASAAMHGPLPTEFPPMEGTGLLDAMSINGPFPSGLPDWISEAEFAVYVDQFTSSGFFGPVSWYRNLDADHEITKTLPPPGMPCGFIGGEKDGVIAHRPEYVEAMGMLLADFKGTIMIPDAGHWTQQEKPTEFNSALFDLLGRL